MEFPFNMYIAGGLAAFLTSLTTLPLWRRWAIRTGFVDDPGHRKIHSTPIPLAGGWAVLTGIALPLALGAAVALAELLPGDWLRYGVSRRGAQLIVLLLGCIGMALCSSVTAACPARAPYTKPSSSELLASRFAP